MKLTTAAMLHQRQKKEARWLVTIEVRKKQFKAKTVLASSLKKIIQLLLYTFLLYEIHKKINFHARQSHIKFSACAV